MGESYKNSPPIFKKAKKELASEIIHFGYADTFEKYATFLSKADFLPVTSRQDFFGGSVVEAIYCNCIPILPKRLAYPEHIPNEYYDWVFYNGQNDFFQKLKERVIEFRQPKNQVLSDFVARYDWSILAPVYDSQCQRVKNKYAD